MAAKKIVLRAHGLGKVMVHNLKYITFVHIARTSFYVFLWLQFVVHFQIPLFNIVLYIIGRRG